MKPNKIRGVLAKATKFVTNTFEGTATEKNIDV
jgi:hypothetical protein